MFRFGKVTHTYLASKSPGLNVAWPQRRLASMSPGLNVAWPQCRGLNVAGLNVAWPQCPIVGKRLVRQLKAAVGKSEKLQYPTYQQII